MIKNRRFALIFRAASLLFAIAGVLSMMGVFQGSFQFEILAYYTMQSNIFAIVLFGMLTIRTAAGLREGEKGNVGYYARCEMICTFDIMLTFVVFWAILAPTIFTMNGEYELWTFDNLAVHGITPLLCLTDYILFTQARHLKYRDVYYVTIFPLIYLVATSVAGLLGYVYTTSPVDGKPVRFPYFFYDYDRIGAMSFVYIGALIIIFMIVAHGLYLVDKKIRKE